MFPAKAVIGGVLLVAAVGGAIGVAVNSEELGLSSSSESDSGSNSFRSSSYSSSYSESSSFSSRRIREDRSTGYGGISDSQIPKPGVNFEQPKFEVSERIQNDLRNSRR